MTSKPQVMNQTAAVFTSQLQKLWLWTYQVSSGWHAAVCAGVLHYQAHMCFASWRSGTCLSDSCEPPPEWPHLQRQQVEYTKDRGKQSEPKLWPLNKIPPTSPCISQWTRGLGCFGGGSFRCFQLSADPHIQALHPVQTPGGLPTTPGPPQRHWRRAALC